MKRNIHLIITGILALMLATPAFGQHAHNPPAVKKHSATQGRKGVVKRSNGRRLHVVAPPMHRYVGKHHKHMVRTVHH